MKPQVRGPFGLLTWVVTGHPGCRRGSVLRLLSLGRMGDHPSVRSTRGCWTGRPPPARPCSGWGLPSRPGHPGRWCALTAPFHPCLCRCRPSAVCSLLHFPAGHPDWLTPAPCPVEPRPSSTRSRRAATTHPGAPSPPWWHVAGDLFVREGGECPLLVPRRCRSGHSRGVERAAERQHHRGQATSCSGSTDLRSSGATRGRAVRSIMVGVASSPSAISMSASLRAVTSTRPSSEPMVML